MNGRYYLSARYLKRIFIPCTILVGVVLLVKYAEDPRYVGSMDLFKIHTQNRTSEIRIISSGENRASQIRIIPPGENVQVSELQIHITTASHYDKYKKGGYQLFLNGWARHNETKKFKCCLFRKLPSKQNLGNDSFIEVDAQLYHMHTQYIVDMQNAEFVCSISAEKISTIRDANFTYVTFAKKTCSQESPKVAMEIMQPKPVSNSVGICLKITYGSLNPEQIVEWFEYVRLMGVTKVFTYYFDVDPEVFKVLEYYQSVGYLDLLLIHPAKSKYGTDRGFRHPRWDEQAWMDEVMAANDCKHRMAGFDFVFVMDMDEFIVPKGNLTSYLGILQQAKKDQPKASCFPFDSHIIMPDWGVTRYAPLHFTKYTKRTLTPNYDGWWVNVRWAFQPKLTFWLMNNYVYPIKDFIKGKSPSKHYILFSLPDVQENLDWMP